MRARSRTSGSADGGAEAEEKASGDEESGGGEDEQAADEDAKAEEAEADDAEADEGEADAEESGEREEQPVAAESGGGETEAAAAAAPARSGGGANGGGERVKASPVARRMARELGVEIASIEGSGPGGRIVKADVEAAAKNGGGTKAEPAEAEAGADGDGDAPEKKKEKQPAAAGRTEAGPKGQAEIQELTRLQQTVSRRMAESKATAPDFSIGLTVDMTKAVELRARLKEVADPAPSFNDMVVKAAAKALTEFPKVNGAYRDGKFELYENVNIGVAVAAQDALVVPTVFNADQKSLGQISKDARAVIEKVRDKTVTPPELSGGTFTVSNLGMFGIEFFSAIINPPQAAILTVGKLAKQPAVDESGRIVARDQMTLSLVCDHRILYGADGAQFLARIKELLESPLSLAL